MRSIEAMQLDDDMDQYLEYPNRIRDTVHCLAFELSSVAMIRSAHRILSAPIVNDNTNETLVPMARKNYTRIQIQRALFLS